VVFSSRFTGFAALSGKPDVDSHLGCTSSESDSKPPRIEHRRMIQYHGLSDVADVWITERPDGNVSIALQGKYIGDTAK